MYWEKLKYAQSMTNASDSLPRSWKWLGLSSAPIGARRARNGAIDDRERQRGQSLAAHRR